MSLVNRRGGLGSVKYLDEDTMEIIRELSHRHRVAQWYVVALAVEHFNEQLGRSIPLPDDWLKPRGW